MTERGSKTGREKRKDRESSEFRKGGGGNGRPPGFQGKQA